MRTLAKYTLIAVMASALISCSDDANTPTPLEGGICSVELSLVCGTSTAGAENAALYCFTGTYGHVFDCPSNLPCRNSPDHLKVACGSGDFVYFFITNEPCAPEGSRACGPGLGHVYTCQQGEWSHLEECSEPLTPYDRCALLTPGEGDCPITSVGGCIGCRSN